MEHHGQEYKKRSADFIPCKDLVKKPRPENVGSSTFVWSTREDGNDTIVKKIIIPAEIQQQAESFTPEEALSMIIYLNLTKNAYLFMRRKNKIYPSWHQIVNTKEKCYPIKSGGRFEVTDTKVKINVNALASKTMERILNSDNIYENIKNIPISQDGIRELKMTAMWGMDGTTTPAHIDDYALMITTMTMVKLTGNNEEGNEVVIWENDKRKSAFTTRPIKIEFQGETDDYINATKREIEDEITNLITKIDDGTDVNINVKYDFNFTITDGKVFKTITGTSSAQKCTICDASPSEMNNPENLNGDKFKPICKDRLHYNIQPLHTTMNAVLNLFKLGERKDIKKWKVVSSEDKNKLEENKKVMKEAMWREFGIKIYETPQTEGGASLTKNAARKILKEPKKLAQVLGINEELVMKLSLILEAAQCQEEVNFEEFAKLCREVTDLYIKHYPWNFIPSSLHKLLVHGKDIIKELSFPLERMSEEGAETQNKFIRRYNTSIVRKTSPKAYLEDVFNRRIIASDPKIFPEYIKGGGEDGFKDNADEDETESETESEDESEMSELDDSTFDEPEPEIFFTLSEQNDDYDELIKLMV